jgi:hypothetical protein
MLFRFQTRIACGNTSSNLMMHRPFKKKSLAMSRFSLRHLPAIFPASSAVGATGLLQLDRDPAHYLVPGVRAVNLKIFSIAAPGCNVYQPAWRRVPMRTTLSSEPA